MPVERGVSSATAAGKIGHRGENRGFTAAGERDAGRLEQDVPEHRHGHVRAGDGLLASLDRVVEQRLVRDRDLRLRVRSALPVDAGAIDWTRDFVYRDGTLVTTFEADGEVLKPILNLRGDPRAHLDANGAVIANGGYYLGPFGIQYSPTPESVDPNADPVKAVHRFTGHERDVNQVSNALDDLDYMHARYMMPRIGRFLSVDPINSADPKVPQSWNRYSYARNNPTTFTDPTGKCTDPGGSGSRICIQTFIPTRTFGGFAGDNRGASSDGGTFRTSQFLNVLSSDQRVLLSETFVPGVSQLGALARKAEVGNQEVVPTFKGIFVSAAASDGLLFGAAPDLKYDLLLAPKEGGGLSVSGTHTAFPSIEVWLYEDGKDPALVYSYDAPADSTAEGVADILRELEIPEQ
jgi:RHS repeat-associated protein